MAPELTINALLQHFYMFAVPCRSGVKKQGGQPHVTVNPSCLGATPPLTPPATVCDFMPKNNPESNQIGLCRRIGASPLSSSHLAIGKLKTKQGAFRDTESQLEASSQKSSRGGLQIKPSSEENKPSVSIHTSGASGRTCNRPTHFPALVCVGSPGCPKNMFLKNRLWGELRAPIHQVLL